MAGALQTLTALRDLSSLYPICLVSLSSLCPSELNLIKPFLLFEDSVVAVLASGSCSSDTVPAQECLSNAILGKSSTLMGVVSRIKATKQTAIHNELFVNNFGCRN